VARAVGGATQFEETAALEDAVQDRLGQIGIVQDPAPRGEGFVRREKHRAVVQVAFVDDVEEDVGEVGPVGEIADFVDLCGAPHSSIYGKRAVVWSAVAPPQESSGFSHA